VKNAEQGYQSKAIWDFSFFNLFSETEKTLLITKKMQAGVFLCWCVLVCFFLLVVIGILMKLNPNRCLPRCMIRNKFVRHYLHLNYVDGLKQQFVPWDT